MAIKEMVKKTYVVTELRQVLKSGNWTCGEWDWEATEHNYQDINAAKRFFDEITIDDDTPCVRLEVATDEFDTEFDCWVATDLTLIAERWA